MARLAVWLLLFVMWGGSLAHAQGDPVLEEPEQAIEQEVDPELLSSPREPEVDPDLLPSPVDLPVPALASAPAEPEWLRRAQPDSIICPFRGRIRYEPGEIECGLIAVPENREVAGSRTIELHYVRLRATGKDEDGKEVETRDDPVIYLTGGPGVGVETYVARLKDHRILERRDLYILEQRGIGNSGSVCPFFSSRNRAGQNRETLANAQRVQIEQAVTCAENARAQGIDLRGYNTFENARDVRALRQALGLAQWNVWGISYGSVLGQALVKTDPDGIRALVLDAIVPLDIGELMRIARWYARDLDKLFEACAGQPSCRDAYPDLQARYFAALESISAEAISIDVKADEPFPEGRVHVHADVVAGLPFSALYEQKQHPALPALLAGLSRAVEQRDLVRFKAMMLAASSGSGLGDFGPGMAMAIRCQDGYMTGVQRIAASEHAEHPVLAAAFFSPEVVDEMIAGCVRAGLAPRDPAAYSPVHTEIPTVIANGAWDPVTPTPLAEYVARGFHNGRLVEFPHAGHGPTRSLPCGGEFLNRFFDDPSAPLDMDCVNDGEQAATYLAPYYDTDAFARLLVLAQEKRKAAIGHGIWAGVSIVLLLLGLLVFVFGWFARRLEGEPRRPGSLARWLAGLTALTGVVHVVGLAVAAQLAFKAHPAMLLFGTHGWGLWFAWIGPALGVLGLLTLIVAILGAGLGRAGRTGSVVIALAAISLAVFGLYWGFWPIP